MLPVAPKFDHAFRLSLQFTEPFRYPSTTGHRAALNISSGTAKGPKLDAHVADDGGELMVIRPDGIVDWDSRMMLRAGDGVMIYWRARGNIMIGTEGARAFFETGGLPASKLHLSPYFDTPKGPHDWMTRSSFVAFGSVGSGAAEIDVFHVTAE
jgi:hypothetical protein